MIRNITPAAAHEPTMRASSLSVVAGGLAEKTGFL